MLDRTDSLTQVTIKDLPVRFTAAQTTEILTNWVESSHITASTLSTLTLESANFSTDEASEALAKLVDMAPQVSTLNIESQNADRPVRVVLVPATANADTNGSISIKNYVSDEMVHTMTTARTSSPIVNYGDVLREMTFTWNCRVDVSDEEEAGHRGTGETTDCASLRALVQE